MSKHIQERELFGIIAEFEEANELLAAAQKTTAAGYRQVDAYSPFPVHGLSEALTLDKQRNWLPYIVLLGAVLGGLAGYMLQYYTSVIAYPINVGSRPLNSVPAFLVITFEGAVLVAAVMGLVGMLALNKLPMPYHPVFNAPGFERASQDRFFLCIMATDPKFEETKTKAFLQSLSPAAVTELEQAAKEKIYD
ncbi:MAG: DUF3341 domain-containing protein [Anaerolineae bacterium]|nr:DUF3341 domain-containing protein [Anaerolineae bacterium]